MTKKAAQVEIRALTIKQVPLALAQSQEAIVGVEVTQEVNQAQVVAPEVTVEAVAAAEATVKVMIASPRKGARRER